MPTVRLDWSDPNSGANQEDEIRVYRSTTSFNEDSLPAILATIPADSVLYDDITVLSGQTYFYAIAMVLSGSVSPSFVSVTTGAAGELKWANVSFVEHDQISTAWAGSTCRMSIAADQFEFDGDQIRLTAQAWDANGCEIDQVWIGKKGTGTHDFDSPPTQVLWGALPGFTLTSGQEIVSDPIAIAYDASVDDGLVVSWQVDGSATEDNIASRETLTNWQSSAKVGADASTEVAAGYSALIRDSYLLSAIEFEANTLPSGLWFVEEEVTQDQTSSGWEEFTGRIVVDGSVLQGDSAKMRITIKAQSGQSMIADDFFVGKKSGAFGYAAAPTRITWGGSNAVTVDAGNQAVSDEIILPYDASIDGGLVFAFYKGLGATGENYNSQQSRTGWETYFKAGNHTQEDPGSGFSVGSRDAVAIVLIEFFGETGVESQWVGAIS